MVHAGKGGISAIWSLIWKVGPFVQYRARLLVILTNAPAV